MALQSLQHVLEYPPKRLERIFLEQVGALDPPRRCNTRDELVVLLNQLNDETTKDIDSLVSRRDFVVTKEPDNGSIRLR